MIGLVLWNRLLAMKKLVYLLKSFMNIKLLLSKRTRKMEQSGPTSVRTSVYECAAHCSGGREVSDI